MAMKKMINALTGTVMWVDDDRQEEYLRAGHHPADQPEPVKQAPAKRQIARKTTATRKR